MTTGLRDMKAAADWLGIPFETLRKYVAARRVPHTRIGKHVRFSQEHLEAIAAAGEVPVAAAPSLALVRALRAAQTNPPKTEPPKNPPPPAAPRTPPPPAGPKKATGAA